MNYSKFVESRRIRPKVTAPTDLYEALLALPNEVGELLDHYKKYIRDGRPLDEKEILLEIGDVLFAIQMICNYHNVTLEDVIKINIEKVERKHHTDLPTKEKDHE